MWNYFTTILIGKAIKKNNVSDWRGQGVVYKDKKIMGDI